MAILGMVGSAVGCNTVPPGSQPAATLVAVTSTSTPLPGPAVLLNPGFEEKSDSGAPAGWNSTGAENAVLIEDRGHSGNFRLTHKASEILHGGNLPVSLRAGQ